MRNLSRGNSVTVVLLMLTILLSATTLGLAAPNISGRLDNGIDIKLEDPYEFTGNNSLHLNLDEFFNNGGFHVGVQLANLWPSQQLDFKLDEAYVDYYTDSMDLRVGNQRFSWGTAMKINPTSVLNPVNINNPMGDKLPVFAGAVDYYVTDDMKFTGILIPFHVAAISKLPDMGPGMGMPEISKPAPTLRNAEYAAKLTMMALGGFDLSASYFNGKADTPTLTMAGGMPQVFYEDIQIFGADFATSVGDFGLWAEAAYTIPEKTDHYYQWIAGGDYGFANGLVAIGQYLWDSKMDTGFVILGMEQPLGMHQGRLGLLYNTETQGYMLSSELVVSLTDVVALTVEANYFGDESKKLGLLPKEENQVKIQISASF